MILLHPYAELLVVLKSAWNPSGIAQDYRTHLGSIQNLCGEKILSPSLVLRGWNRGKCI
ncbi:hypothetical protein PAXRUDRAFT_821568 [Paxillus rubicundulus Ve08.2h10]|uniref:Uncharacterized protein n=1 Tax=Paxillus rubicundulus Ve08.2h10 TaxID=930991 RepID=A0A0D0EAR3_9AGAM|nr:hypothetical protein PAXRUDRAFT_821568 [Paxillus rubicundulus Ve08.2h10]